MPMVNVSMGELVDKLTILEIKSEKGLPVSKELQILEEEYVPEFTIEFCKNILKSINEQLWLIEDEKRQCEAGQSFEEDFISLSRLVYMLNDERARIKKIIDKLSNSDITEHKSHGDYTS